MALRLASARVSVAVGVPRVLRPVCCRVWAFIQRGFGAVDEDFVLDNRGVESRDEFKEIGLAFEEIGEKIKVVRGQGAELVEERLLGLRLLAERKA